MKRLIKNMYGLGTIKEPNRKNCKKREGEKQRDYVKS